MENCRLETRRFSVPAPTPLYMIEAECVRCGDDLVVVVGGGSNYHLGAAALTISLPSIKNTGRLTNSTYQIPVPGHKEESLAREGSLILSRAMGRNVLVTAGIHVDGIAKEDIAHYTEAFYQLIEVIRQAYAGGAG